MTQTTISDRKQAERWLKSVAGDEATFRDGQWESITRIVDKRERLLVVQRTGWGKSMVYFIATRFLRNDGRGPTLLISPLLSLMRDQIRAAEALGIHAETINSTNPDDHADIEQRIIDGEIDLLLISPERLANDKFRSRVWSNIRSHVGLMVIDEAHCISDWGHDFRPNYRRIMTILDELPNDTPVLATTATAKDRVVADVSEIVGDNVHIIRGPLTRRSLRLYNYSDAMSSAYRLALLSELLNKLPGSGIVYCSTTRDCVKVSNWLNQQGHDTKPYYGSVDRDLGMSREKLETDLMDNRVKALVASVALGMGFDKPDLSFVIHYQHPGSIVGYYQQIGRAGRGVDKAWVILLHGAEDAEIQTHFIDTAFPSPERVQQVVDTLAHEGELKRTQVEQFVNCSRSTMEKVLTHLEVEGMITRNALARTYELTGADHQLDYDRWGDVTERRYDELAQMQAYIQHDGCLMQFIADALDDPSHVKPCGACRNCTGAKIKIDPATRLVEEARSFLREGQLIEIEPRKRYPGGLDAPWKGSIKPANKIGYVLCHYFDEGYGKLVREGKYIQQHFPDELVIASHEMLQSFVSDSGIEWVTAVPSLRHPRLVPDFAKRLAEQLELPFVEAVTKLTEHPEQKTMQNSYQQVHNLIGTFEVAADIPETSVLLVDDMVDSKWTFTIVGALLSARGCSAVYPFALATTA
ncbi:MAG: RecQ family ATP-dependent DNA helicase [Chloroflexota bacterium]